MNCTWVGCTREGTKEMRDKHGVVWATLCPEHEKEHLDSIDKAVLDPEQQNIAKMVGIWIKCQGGAERAAKRMRNG